jgi:carnosine synthase
LLLLLPPPPLPLQYLDGDEVDCDLVIWDGKCTYGAVTDNWPTIEPYFNETGSNCPSILPISKQRVGLGLGVTCVGYGAL